MLSSDGSLKTPATVTSVISQNRTKSNTSQCSGDAFNRSAETITAHASRGKISDEPITVPNEAYNNKIQKDFDSLLGGPSNFHDQGPTVAKFSSNINSKLQLQTTTSVILDQSSGLSKQNGEIRRSNSEMTTINSSHSMTSYSLPSEANVFIRNDRTTTSTNEQTVDTFSEIQSGDLIVENIPQSLQPVCSIQDCSSSTEFTLPPTSVRNNVRHSNGVGTKQHEKTNNQQSCGPTLYNSTQYSTKKALEVPNATNNNMHYDVPSSTTRNDELKIPVNQSLKTSRSVHLVAINIPCDDSGVPHVDTSITDEDINTEYTTANSDEALELQSNPAYTTFDDIASEDHLYEEIV